jgi:hypothetical protein
MLWVWSAPGAREALPNGWGTSPPTFWKGPPCPRARPDPQNERLPGFGDIHGPKAYKFIRFGDIHGTKAYKSIGFGDIHGPTAYKLIRFGAIHGPKV